MRPLSATECITPAIARTKLVLFTPFRLGRTWKLCATGYLCRIGTLFFPFPIVYLFFLPAAQHAAGTTGAVLLVSAVLVLMALTVFVFYLCSRLQFAFFDIVINRGEFVAPVWRKYGRQSRPWTGLKIAFGFLPVLACALPIAVYFRNIIPLFRAMRSLTPGLPPPPEFMKATIAFYAGYGIVLLVLGCAYVISSLLSDFIVPSLALEGTGVKEAFRRMGELIRRELGEVTLYALLKVGIGFTSYLGVIIAWEIVIVLATLILVAIAALIGFLLHLIGIPSIILTVLAFILGFAWYLFLIYSMMFPLGAVFTFMDAYAHYFLGGRYPKLGDLLDRSAPPPALIDLPGYPNYPLQPGPPPAPLG